MIRVIFLRRLSQKYLYTSPNVLVSTLRAIFLCHLGFLQEALMSTRCLDSVCPKIHSNPNTGDSRGILPHSIMYGAIQMLVGYERFGEILHEDCVFMDAVWGFHAPIR